MTSDFTDKNRALAGNQSIVAGDAVLFSYGATVSSRLTYLLVASGTTSSINNDLFIRMGSGLTSLAVGQIASNASNFLFTA